MTVFRNAFLAGMTALFIPATADSTIVWRCDGSQGYCYKITTHLYPGTPDDYVYCTQWPTAVGVPVGVVGTLSNARDNTVLSTDAITQEATSAFAQWVQAASPNVLPQFVFSSGVPYTTVIDALDELSYRELAAQYGQDILSEALTFTHLGAAGEITGFQMYLNDHWNWSLACPSGSACDRNMDSRLHAAVLHELGHALGLDHPGTIGCLQVMVQGLADGAGALVDLKDRDIYAIRWLYRSDIAVGNTFHATGGSGHNTLSWHESYPSGVNHYVISQSIGCWGPWAWVMDVPMVGGQTDYQVQVPVSCMDDYYYSLLDPATGELVYANTRPLSAPGCAALAAPVLSSPMVVDDRGSKGRVSLQWTGRLDAGRGGLHSTDSQADKPRDARDRHVRHTHIPACLGEQDLESVATAASRRLVRRRRLDGLS